MLEDEVDDEGDIEECSSRRGGRHGRAWVKQIWAFDIEEEEEEEEERGRSWKRIRRRRREREGMSFFRFFF